MISIRPLIQISFEAIHHAFVQAFADYEEPFDLTIEELRLLVERRGFDCRCSFGAFDGDRLVGFTLNGVGEWNGVRTVYDTGTGIVKSYRQRGIATQIFAKSIPTLKAAGIQQYLLEVIKTNTKAIELYRKCHFEVQRELGYYKSPVSALKINPKKTRSDRVFRDISRPEWNIFKTFWEFSPSWQNAIRAIEQKPTSFRFIGLFEGDKLIGYGIVEPRTGDVPQFAIAHGYRREGLGTTLFEWFAKTSRSGFIKIVNTDAADKGMESFLASLGFLPGLGQYEMLLEF